MQVVLWVLTFLGGGGVVTLVVTGVNALLEARRERRPRQRVLAIRSAAETLALVTDDVVKSALQLQLQAEAKALAQSYEPRPVSEKDAAELQLSEPKLVALATAAVLALGVGVVLDVSSGAIDDSALVWAAAGGGLLAAASTVIAMWRDRLKARRK